MSRPYLYQVHVADGFVDDCEELIQRCTQGEILTYPVFAEIWKEMNFGNIYQGRTLGVEVAELSEEVVLIAKRFMLANTSNYEEQVAGLFLVYGLINLQPFPGFASLRIVPDDVPAINRIEVVARRDRRLDVLYILGQLLIKGPVQYAATEREYGFEASYRKYHEGMKLIDKQGVRPTGLFKRQNEELDALREINHVARLYHGVKKHITEDKPDRNLNYSEEKVFEEANISLKKLLNGDFTDPRVIEQDDSMKRSNLVFEIRQRAMRTAVDSMKHRSGVEERNKSPKQSKSPRKSKSPKGDGATTSKVDQLSPKKSGKKRRKKRKSKVKAKGKGRGKRTKKLSSSESDLSDVSLDSDSLSPCQEEDPESDLKGEEVDIDVTKLKSALPGAFEDIEVEVPPIRGSLPVIVNTDDSSLLEIEIIDNYKEDEREDAEDPPISPKRSKRKAEESQASYIAEKSPENSGNSEEDGIFKKPSDRRHRRPGQRIRSSKLLYGLKNK